MATSQEDLFSSEDPRLAYYTTTGDGFSYLSLNGTSMQNGVVVILIISVLASLLLPYYGISRGIFGIFDETISESENVLDGFQPISTGYELNPFQRRNRRSNESSGKLLSFIEKAFDTFSSES